MDAVTLRKEISALAGPATEAAGGPFPSPPEKLLLLLLLKRNVPPHCPSCNMASVESSKFLGPRSAVPSTPGAPRPVPHPPAHRKVMVHPPQKRGLTPSIIPLPQDRCLMCTVTEKDDVRAEPAPGTLS